MQPPLAPHEDSIATRLRREMEEAEVSINELARRTGMKRQQISSYVNGQVTPQWPNLKRIADKLERPVSWFTD